MNLVVVINDDDCDPYISSERERELLNSSAWSQYQQLYERTSEEKMLLQALQGIIILCLIREDRRQRLNLDFSHYYRSIGNRNEQLFSLSHTHTHTHIHLYSYSFDYTIEVFFLSTLILYSNLPASDDLCDINPSKKKEGDSPPASNDSQTSIHINKDDDGLKQNRDEAKVQYTMYIICAIA